MEGAVSSSSQHESVSTDEYLERIYLRFAMIESDEQLQKFTDAYLIRLIETAGAEPKAVTKVGEILSHYNRRAKSNPAVKYPVETLLSMLNGKSAVTANLSLVYLRFATVHLNDDDYLSLLPVLLEVLSSKINEPSQCTELLGLCVPAFMILTQRERHTWPQLSLSPELKILLLRFLHCVLIFPVDRPDEIKSTCEAIRSGTKVSTPAMTVDEYLMVAEKVFPKDVSIVPIKLCVVKLLTSGLFEDSAIFSIIVLGSAEGIEAVSGAAEAILKKIDIQLCVDNRVVVDELMTAYLGTTMPSKPVIGKSSAVSPANSMMKQKILQFLTRSAIAPVSYMNNMKVCLDGLTQTSITKLLIAALNFLLKVIEKMPAAAQKNLSLLLFQRLQKILGEVKNGTAVSLIYRCMGMLGNRDISIVSAQEETVMLAFRAIATAQDEIAYAVIDCLTQWLEAFRKSSDRSLTEKLKSLIQEFITHENSRCRLIALKYTEAFLSSDDIDLRWMLLQSCGDNRDEIRNEASRLLDVSLRMRISIEVVITYLWDHLCADIIDPETGKEKTSSSQAFSPLVHQMCSRYLWSLLAHLTGAHVDLKTNEGGDDWMELAPKIAQQIKKLPGSSQERLTRISLQALKDAHEVPLFHIAACFSAACPLSGPSVALANVCIQRARGTTRSDMANVATHLATSLMNKKELESAMPAAFSALEKVNVTTGDCWLASAFIASYGNSHPTILTVISRLINIADEGYNKPSGVLESALGSLANILRTVLFHNKDFELSAEVLDRVLLVCEKIAVSRKDAVSTKAHEEATLAIGFCATTMDSTVYDKLASALFSIGNGPPQPEVQLIVGAALYNIAFGPYSNARRNFYLTSEEDFQIASLPCDVQKICEERLAQTLSKIFDEKLPSTNHHERRSALIWLLVIVRKSIRVGAAFLQGILDRIQSAFGMGLAENDDFTQDVASSGIGLVYEIASVDQRKALVGDLISNISEGKPFATTKVDANTEIFSKEQHVTGPDGQQLSTFKELCSLATDLNQPDLIYKFMNLARHNSSWNTKKGAALGFAAVLEEASSELEPFVGLLVPKLYRYRYDPDLKVRQSMRSIWSALTASRRGLVEEYADDIAKELQQQLTHHEWRVRESACLALSDLVQGNDTRYIHSITPDLILKVFRVRDDVKESVRLAANRAVVTLGKLAVRLSSETSKGNDPSVFLSSLLPILVQHGIHSETKINKKFSISLLLEVSKTAGSQLRPHLAELIPSLIDSISDTEPAVLNYVAARSSLAELEMLDDARAQMARNSPMMTAIHDLLPQIDGSVLVAMQPRLCEQLRSSAGTSTRTACAQLLTLLSLRAPQLLGQHQAQCDKLFNALISGTRDRNPSVRKHFASAASYMAKYASHASFETLMRTVLKDLLADNESMKQSAKHVMKNLSANCPELFQGYSKLVVPYVFLETSQQVIRGDEASKIRREEWCDLWNEIVPSTEAAVRMYRGEVISFAVDILQNNDVWSVRAQAARMLSETMLHLQERLDGDDAASLLSSLMPLLSGRIWPGKENLLAAVAAIFSCAGPRLREKWSDSEKNEIFDTLSREASKKKKEYAAAGLAACGAFARSLPCTKAADWLLERVETNVGKALNPSDDKECSEEEQDGPSREAKIVEFVIQNMTALTNAIGAYSKGQEALPALDVLCTYLESPKLFWRAKQALVAGILDLIMSWQVETGVEMTKLVKALLVMAEDMIGQQRKSIAIQCLSVISKLAKHKTGFAIQWSDIRLKAETSRLIQEAGLSDDLVALNQASVDEMDQ